MAVDNIKLEFKDGFKGKMQSPTSEILIGNQEDGMQPYHLLFGALGSCFYATFLSIVYKKKLTFDGASLEISGKKREEVPTTLEYVKIKMVVKNASDEKQFLKSADLGAKFCSIHETIAQVSKIDLEVEFE